MKENLDLYEKVRQEYTDSVLRVLEPIDYPLGGVTVGIVDDLLFTVLKLHIIDGKLFLLGSEKEINFKQVDEILRVLL